VSVVALLVAPAVAGASDRAALGQIVQRVKAAARGRAVCAQAVACGCSNKGLGQPVPAVGAASAAGCLCCCQGSVAGAALPAALIVAGRVAVSPRAPSLSGSVLIIQHGPPVHCAARCV